MGGTEAPKLPEECMLHYCTMESSYPSDMIKRIGQLHIATNSNKLGILSLASVLLCFECVPLGYQTDLNTQTKSTSALQSDIYTSSGNSNLHKSLNNEAESAFRVYTPSHSSQPSSPDKQQRRYTPTGTSGRENYFMLV